MLFEGKHTKEHVLFLTKASYSSRTVVLHFSWANASFICLGSWSVRADRKILGLLIPFLARVIMRWVFWQLVGGLECMGMGEECWESELKGVLLEEGRLSTMGRERSVLVGIEWGVALGLLKEVGIIIGKETDLGELEVEDNWEEEELDVIWKGNLVSANVTFWKRNILPIGLKHLSPLCWRL